MKRVRMVVVCLVVAVGIGAVASATASAGIEVYAVCSRRPLQTDAKAREKAMEDLSRISLLVNQLGAYGLPSLKYILHLRGVFPNWRCRGKEDDSHFDAEDLICIDAAAPAPQAAKVA